MAMVDSLVLRCNGCFSRGLDTGSVVRKSNPATLAPVKGMGLGSSLPRPILRVRQQQRGLSRWKGRLRQIRCVAQPLQDNKVVATPASEPTHYNDSWIEVAAVEFLTSRLEVISGKKTDLKGYDGFVDMTRKLVHGLPSSKQRDMIRDLLHIVLPGWLLFMFYSVPKTKFIKEFYALFTKAFFRWLVGDCEIREAEVNGVMMKSTVHIKKCRYLENSKCVGLCVNLCKNPTQEFIGKNFGMPLTMNPNFEDMSCDMIYGLHPPPLEEDAAYQQPCYSLCKTAKSKPNCA